MERFAGELVWKKNVLQFRAIFNRYLGTKKHHYYANYLKSQDKY